MVYCSPYSQGVGLAPSRNDNRCEGSDLTIGRGLCVRFLHTYWGQVTFNLCVFCSYTSNWINIKELFERRVPRSVIIAITILGCGVCVGYLA